MPRIQAPVENHTLDYPNDTMDYNVRCRNATGELTLLKKIYCDPSFSSAFLRHAFAMLRVLLVAQVEQVLYGMDAVARTDRARGSYRGK